MRLANAKHVRGTLKCIRENKVRGSTLLSSLKDGTLKADLKEIGVKALGKSSHFLL